MTPYFDPLDNPLQALYNAPYRLGLEQRHPIWCDECDRPMDITLTQFRPPRRLCGVCYLAWVREQTLQQ